MYSDIKRHVIVLPHLQRSQYLRSSEWFHPSVGSTTVPEVSAPQDTVVTYRHSVHLQDTGTPVGGMHTYRYPVAHSAVVPKE